MKIISLLIYILSISPAFAEIYKCINNGQTSYQQTQCVQQGTEFIPAPDISIEQQEAAIKKLNSDLAAIDEKKKLQKEADDKERLIQVEEDKARAIREQTSETARQTDAIIDSNNRINNQPYYYPYRPIVRPLPDRPVVAPLKSTQPSVEPIEPIQPTVAPSTPIQPYNPRNN